MKNYAVGRVGLEGKPLRRSVFYYGRWRKATLSGIENVIREACAEAIADATRKANRRAARIVRNCRPYSGFTTEDIVQAILGTTKGGKRVAR